jgi:hypothetical protein
MEASLLSDSSEVDSEPLWWPPAKIMGRHLAPFLAKHVGLSAPALATRDALPEAVDVEHFQDAGAEA